ncbi:MAG TPA: hypothetical protein VGR77_00560 [Candidatus Dormibacteraeota bacterium]|nr:hypothetical protein [Candidatus Dormibacteraeota bacterium]
MNLAVALLADSAIANPQDGKLYVLGGGISWIGAPSFPAVHPAIALALNFLFAPSECGRPHTVEVRLLDPDGREIVPAFTQQFVPPKNPTDPTLPSGWVNVCSYIQLRFEKPGDNAFSIMLDGQEVASLPLRLIQIPSLAGMAAQPEA